MESSVVLGSEKDFLKFLDKIPKWNRNDVATLRRYWSIAVKRKNILVLQHVGPLWAMVTVITVDCLPALQNNKKTKVFAKGWVGLKIPKEKHYAFGAMILDHEDTGPLHSGEIPAEIPQIIEEEPPKKKRGRPKKVA